MRAVLQGGSGTVLSPSVGSVGQTTGASVCLCEALSLGMMGMLLTDLRPLPWPGVWSVKNPAVFPLLCG